DLQEASLHALPAGLGDGYRHTNGLVRSVEDLLHPVRRLDGLIGQAPDLARDDGESFAVLTRSNRLDGGVERQHVRLVRQVFYCLCDAADLHRPLVELSDASSNLVKLSP